VFHPGAVRYQRVMSDKELGIYVNDHLTGASGGVSLARRAEKNSTDAERTAMWDRIASEVEEDREILIRIRDLIGAKPTRLKYLAARLGERLGRLKPNGRLVRKTDLGQFLELELLVIGVTGKLALWRALDELGDPRLREIDFDGLSARAESQRGRLDEFRIRLAAKALG